MIVRLSAEAERDLERIGDYIASDNPERALSFVRELRAACMGLAEFPERFPIIHRYADRALRCRVRGHYAIIYRVENDVVTVLHVLHGARDFEQLLG